MEAIHLVVIGYGGMGSYHAEQLLPKESCVKVVGTFDILAERQEAAHSVGHQTYQSLAEVLADPAVEAVLIATPNDSHKELAIKSLKAGKHVLCEKPVAMNVAELDEILAVASETNQVFMVHQNRRWDPDFLTVKKLYQEQQLGDLFQIESRVEGANGIPGDWRHQAVHGGGMLLDWGVHLLDQLLFMIDSPVKKVAADLSYILGNEVDDGFISYLTFENGLKAIVEVGTTNYIKLPRWYLKGTNGTGQITDWDLSGELVIQTGTTTAAPTAIQAGVGLTKTMAPPSEEATETRPLPKPQAVFESFYENFYQVVRNQKEPIVKNSEVRRVLRLIEAIFTAAETQTVVEFE